MVSPRACASASLITSPQNISLITTPSNDLDSITLGQLKAMVNSAPKPKARISPLSLAYPVLTMMQQCYYDFKYDDEDTVLNEIEEFYSYVEMPQAAENLKAWEGSFQGGMYKLSPLGINSSRPCGQNGPRVNHKGAEHMWSYSLRV